MSVRRDTTNRLTLFRTCGTCGRSIVTTADTPWVRQVERDGKKQATTYFCSERCFAASYKHIGWYDGKAQERRRRSRLGIGNTDACTWDRTPRTAPTSAGSGSCCGRRR